MSITLTLGGATLRQLFKFLFILLAFSLWHTNAYANSAQDGFNYVEKSQLIALAKSGDSDALFKLGKSHLDGSNAVQSEAVAQRFFFYAAKKGHIEAQTYLDRMVSTPEITRSANTKATTVSHISAKPKASTQTPAVTSPTPIKEKILHEVNNRPELTTLAPEPAPQTPEQTFPTEKTTKVVSNTAVAVLPATVAKPNLISANTPIDLKVPPRRNNAGVFIKFVFVLGLFALSFFAFKAIQQYIRSIWPLPPGFTTAAYLELNPDIKDAGVNPIWHYINHGRIEGRQYRYIHQH